jgi:hypothetical protein
MSFQEFECSLERTSVKLRTGEPRTTLSSLFHHEAEIVPDNDVFTWYQSTSSLYEHLPDTTRSLAEEQSLPLSTRDNSTADQPCWYDPGGVSNQCIRTVQKLREFCDFMVCPDAPSPVDDHQSSALTRLGWMLRDQLTRQVKVKLRNKHNPDSGARPSKSPRDPSLDATEGQPAV